MFEYRDDQVAERRRDRLQGAIDASYPDSVTLQHVIQNSSDKEIQEEFADLLSMDISETLRQHHNAVVANKRLIKLEENNERLVKLEDKVEELEDKEDKRIPNRLRNWFKNLGWQGAIGNKS